MRVTDIRKVKTTNNFSRGNQTQMDWKSGRKWGPYIAI